MARRSYIRTQSRPSRIKVRQIVSSGFDTNAAKRAAPDRVFTVGDVTKSEPTSNVSSPSLIRHKKFTNQKSIRPGFRLLRLKTMIESTLFGPEANKCESYGSQPSPNRLGSSNFRFEKLTVHILWYNDKCTVARVGSNGCLLDQTVCRSFQIGWFPLKRRLCCAQWIGLSVTRYNENDSDCPF